MACRSRSFCPLPLLNCPMTLRRSRYRFCVFAFTFGRTSISFTRSCTIQDLPTGICPADAAILRQNEFRVKLPCDATKRLTHRSALPNHTDYSLSLWLLHKVVVKVLPAERHLAFSLSRQILFPYRNVMTPQMGGYRRVTHPGFAGYLSNGQTGAAVKLLEFIYLQSICVSFICPISGVIRLLSIIAFSSH